jgi:N-methylhydantoinase B
MNAFHWEDGAGWHAPPLASKMRGIRLDRGRAVRLETPGGGGYGPPPNGPHTPSRGTWRWDI